MKLFLKDCITSCLELYMQSFSVIDLYRISYEVCMNFKQNRHAFLPKKENESSGKNYIFAAGKVNICKLVKQSLWFVPGTSR